MQNFFIALHVETLRVNCTSISEGNILSTKNKRATFHIVVARVNHKFDYPVISKNNFKEKWMLS
jgi:hypothetical protein